MIAKLLRWFRALPFRRGAADAVPPAGPGARIVLVGPEYESLTRMMRPWLQELADWAAQGRYQVVTLWEKEATHDRIKAVIQAAGDRGVLLIFYGHGIPDAFLTERSQGLPPYVPVDTGEHGRLCAAEHFLDGTVNGLVGFCCHSARELGRALRARQPASGLLGFRDELPFPNPLSPACVGAFKTPMYQALDPVIRAGRLDPGAPRRLYEGYRKEHDRWCYQPPDGVDRGDAMLVAMCLEELLDILDPTI